MNIGDTIKCKETPIFATIFTIGKYYTIIDVDVSEGGFTTYLTKGDDGLTYAISPIRMGIWFNKKESLSPNRNIIKHNL